jgi:hypothetical protein
MLALARLALKGPYHAASIVGLMAIAAVFLPLMARNSPLVMMTSAILIVMASALVGLVILTQGTWSGLKAIIVSILGITLVTTLVLNAPTFGLSIGLTHWLPTIILAQTLKSSKSLALMILTGLALTILLIAVQFSVWPDLETTLLSVFEQTFAGLHDNPEISSEKVEETILLMTRWVVLALVPSMYLLFVGIMLLSRSMQAKIADSDGYRHEFHVMALGKSAALAGVVVLILSGWLNQDWITSMAIAVLVAFLYQGIAVVHSKLATNRHKALIIGIYYASLIIIFPYVVAISSMTGIIDNWLVFRKNRNIEST